MNEITCCTWHHDPLNSLDGTPVVFGTWKMDHYIVCCTEYLCTSLCLAPGEGGQVYSTPGISPNVLSFGWGIERDLTKLKIPRVGMFDNVAKEPGSYNHLQKCWEGCYFLPLFLFVPPNPPPPPAQCWAKRSNTDGMDWMCPFCIIEDLMYMYGGENVYFMIIHSAPGRGITSIWPLGKEFDLKIG